MLRLKNSAAAVIVFGSSVVFAGSMGAVQPVCTKESVSVPCENKGWEVGGKALYLQSSWGPLDLPVYQVVNGINEFINVDKSWNWGFMVEGAYHFSEGNDFNLNWYHMNTNNSTTVPGDSFASTTGTLLNISITLNPKTTWDAVNMEFGQKVDYTRALRIRYHGGFEFAHIDYQRNSQYFRVTTPTTSMRTISYNGFGPRAGFDGSYAFENGLSLNVGSAIGAYAGTTHFHYISTGVFANGQILGGRNGSLMRVVPEIEARAGACYTKSFVYGDLSLDAGWMWVNYFNPIMHADDNKLQSSDFSVQGPYVGLKWLA